MDEMTWTTPYNALFFATRWLSFRCTSGSKFGQRFHKRFKHLIDQSVDLSIEHSKLTMQIAKMKGKK